MFLIVFLGVFAVGTAAHAHETCDEFCPVQSEEGYGWFLDSTQQGVTCCCLRDSLIDPIVSKPLEQCFEGSE